MRRFQAAQESQSIRTFVQLRPDNRLLSGALQMAVTGWPCQPNADTHLHWTRVHAGSGGMAGLRSTDNEQGRSALVLVPTIRNTPRGLHLGDLISLVIAGVWLMLAAYISWRLLTPNEEARPQYPLLRGAIVGGTLPTTAFLLFAPVVAAASVLQSSLGHTGGAAPWVATVSVEALAAVRGVGRFLDLSTSLPVAVVAGAVFAVSWSRLVSHRVDLAAAR
jgi:hypothetical protein